MRFSLSYFRQAVVAVVATAFAAPLSAQGLTGYNVFTFGSFMQTNSEVNGAFATGGAANFTNSGAGKSIANGTPGAVVAGSMTWTNGELHHGDAYFAGAQSLTGFGHPGGAIYSSAGPVNFLTEKTRLDALSNSYSALATNGTVSGTSSLFFQGSSNSVNVFNVTQAQLAAASSEYKFLVPLNSSIIVNVLGLGNGTFFGNNSFNFCVGNFNNCSQGDNNNPPDLVSRLLWNANTANFTSVSWNSSMRGSFLGTNVGVTAGYGSCIGDFVVATLNSTCEFYNEHYDGFVTTTSVVPEPASFAMMFAGLAGVGFAIRRRNARKI